MAWRNGGEPNASPLARRRWSDYTALIDYIERVAATMEREASRGRARARGAPAAAATFVEAAAAMDGEWRVGDPSVPKSKRVTVWSVMKEGLKERRALQAEAKNRLRGAGGAGGR